MSWAVHNGLPFFSWRRGYAQISFPADPAAGAAVLALAGLRSGALPITRDQLDLTQLLPPPPAPGSAAQSHDVELVAERQKTRSAAEVQRVEDDANVTIFRFADVLGPKFTQGNLPLVTGFFAKVGADTGALVTVAKDCWERPRPFVVDADIHPPGNLVQSTANRPRHRSAGRSCRCLVALPAEAGGAGRLQLFLSQRALHLWGADGDSAGRHGAGKAPRIVCKGLGIWRQSHRGGGAFHHRCRSRAHRCTTAMAAVMMQHPGFKTDLAAARSELRRVLGLPRAMIEFNESDHGSRFPVLPRDLTANRAALRLPGGN